MTRFYISIASLTLAALFALQSCDFINTNKSLSKIQMTDPQPTDTKELASFPISIRGDYLDTVDNSILTINDSGIIKTYDYDYKYPVIDPNHYLKGDSLFGKYDDEKEKVTFSGDTIIRHRHVLYPIFDLSDGNVLKTFRGHYFLNKRNAEYSWGVSIISIDQGVLTVQAIGNEIQVEQIKDMQEIFPDTLAFDIKSLKKSKADFLENNYWGLNKYLRLKQSADKMHWQ